jgi:hypothetical protein
MPLAWPKRATFACSSGVRQFPGPSAIIEVFQALTHVDRPVRPTEPVHLWCGQGRSGVTQMTAQAQSNIGAFPTDTQPPSITEYDSARVSILESGLESKVPAQKERFAIDLPAAGTLVADGRGEIPVRAGRTVVLAMLASCCLSPTLIPAVVDRLVKPELKLNAQGAHGWSKDGSSFVCGAHDWFNRPLALIRSSYVVWCDGAVNCPAPVLTGSGVFEKQFAATRGRRRPGFLPTVNPGAMGLRCRGRARTRIELAEGICGERQPYLVLCLPITTKRAEGLVARWSALAAGMARRAVIGGRALGTLTTLVIVGCVQPRPRSAAG